MNFYVDTHSLVHGITGFGDPDDPFSNIGFMVNQAPNETSGAMGNHAATPLDDAVVPTTVEKIKTFATELINDREVPQA